MITYSGLTASHLGDVLCTHEAQEHACNQHKDAATHRRALASRAGAIVASSTGSNSTSGVSIQHAQSADPEPCADVGAHFEFGASILLHEALPAMAPPMAPDPAGAAPCCALGAPRATTATSTTGTGVFTGGVQLDGMHLCIMHSAAECAQGAAGAGVKHTHVLRARSRDQESASGADATGASDSERLDSDTSGRSECGSERGQLPGPAAHASCQDLCDATALATQQVVDTLDSVLQQRDAQDVGSIGACIQEHVHEHARTSEEPGSCAGCSVDQSESSEPPSCSSDCSAHDERGTAAAGATADTTAVGAGADSEGAALGAVPNLADARNDSVASERSGACADQDPSDAPESECKYSTKKSAGASPGSTGEPTEIDDDRAARELIDTQNERVAAEQEPYSAAQEPYDARESGECERPATAAQSSCSSPRGSTADVATGGTTAEGERGSGGRGGAVVAAIGDESAALDTGTTGQALEHDTHPDASQMRGCGVPIEGTSVGSGSGSGSTRAPCSCADDSAGCGGSGAQDAATDCGDVDAERRLHGTPPTLTLHAETLTTVHVCDSSSAEDGVEAGRSFECVGPVRHDGVAACQAHMVDIKSQLDTLVHKYGLLEAEMRGLERSSALV